MVSPRPEATAPASAAQDPRHRRGQQAEALAWQALMAADYRPFRRNVRAGAGEIDILAWHHGTLVFVEVRSRQSAHFGVPAASIGATKRARLQRAARAFLASWRGELWPATMRFDVVSVVFGPPLQVDILPAAWVIDG